jgi:hypothetical protein
MTKYKYLFELRLQYNDIKTFFKMIFYTTIIYIYKIYTIYILFMFIYNLF